MNTAETLLQGTQRHATFVPRDVLKLDFAEPKPLQYLDVPLHVSAVTNGEGLTTYTVESEHPPVEGSRLFSFLKEVAPYKGYDSIVGVVGDWVLPDEASARPSTATGERMKRHRYLGNAWEVFMESRPAFLDLFSQAQKPILGTNERAINRTFKEISINRIAREVVARGAEGAHQFVGWLEAAEVENSTELVESMARRPGLSKKRERARIVADTIRRLTQEEKRRTMLLARDALYAEVWDEETGEPFYVARDTVVGPEDIEGVTKLEAIIYDKRRKLVVPAAMGRLAPNTMTPQVSWTQDADGERQFVFGSLAERASYRRLEYTDKLLGALLVAYLSPRERSTWITEVPHPDPRRQPQNMGVAQIPVLAMLDIHVPGQDKDELPYRTQLLQSDFIWEAQQAVAA